LFPVVRELPADLETPVSVYLKLAGQGPSFLLESVTGGEQVARYSFIGVNPRQAFVFRGRQLEVHHLRQDGQPVETRHLPADQPPIHALREVLGAHAYQSAPGLPRFAGGLVGYASYETMRFFEPSVELQAHSTLPEAVFLLADTLVAFDHAFGRLLLIGNALEGSVDGLSPETVNARLDEIQTRLTAPLPAPDPAAPCPPCDGSSQANMTRAQYMDTVRVCKEYIAAGDIFQVVPSQRLERLTHAAPFDIYRILRRLNPSPYMFYLDYANLAGGEPLRLIGASPEIHARLDGRQAALRPIAGTRRRGATPEDDLRLERELLADPKERAEHIMLVDLARNDLGRICQYGTVQVSEQMVIERYSHVMHIVSHVAGDLRPGYDALDLLRATFPAGTVSGAPKIRAMQIIAELEPEPRGPYGGIVGYFSFDGSMDTCIALRTMVMRGQTISLQAGAGIVADSDPASEYQETLNKLGALNAAIDLAEGRQPAGAESPALERRLS
jgi:anthranilate synthase component 1